MEKQTTVWVDTYRFEQEWEAERGWNALFVDKVARIAVKEHRTLERYWREGQRYAEVSLMAADGTLDRVASVRVERPYKADAHKATVNWQAWGAQESETAAQVAKALLFASSLADHMLNGFSFLSPTEEEN